MAAKFDLPPLKEYSHSAQDYYATFLLKSDHAVLKALEATFVGKKGSSVDNIADIVSARDYARQMLNNIGEEK